MTISEPPKRIGIHDRRWLLRISAPWDLLGFIVSLLIGRHRAGTICVLRNRQIAFRAHSPKHRAGVSGPKVREVPQEGLWSRVCDRHFWDAQRGAVTPSSKTRSAFWFCSRAQVSGSISFLILRAGTVLVFRHPRLHRARSAICVRIIRHSRHLERAGSQRQKLRLPGEAVGRVQPCPPSDKVCRVIYYRGLCRRVRPAPIISKMRKQPSRKTRVTRCALPAMRAEPAGNLRYVREGFPRPSRVLGLFRSPAASCSLLYINFFLRTHYSITPFRL